MEDRAQIVLESIKLRCELESSPNTPTRLINDTKRKRIQLHNSEIMKLLEDIEYDSFLKRDLRYLEFHMASTVPGQDDCVVVMPKVRELKKLQKQ